jgi:hypothetical protein
MKTNLIILLCVALILSFSSCQEETFTKEETFTEEETFSAETIEEEETLSDVEIELVKTEIVEWQGFNPDEIGWREVEKFDGVDAYIFSCVVCEEEYVQYSFVVSVEYYKGEIDIDAWQLYEKGGAE